MRVTPEPSGPTPTLTSAQPLDVGVDTGDPHPPPIDLAYRGGDQSFLLLFHDLDDRLFSALLKPFNRAGNLVTDPVVRSAEHLSDPLLSTIRIPREAGAVAAADEKFWVVWEYHDLDDPLPDRAISVDRLDD